MRIIAVLFCLVWPTFAGAVDMAAFEAAVACSDNKLRVYAKTTQEPIDAIVNTAAEECRPAWLKAAAAQVDQSKGETFVAGFINAVGQYVIYATPKALAWRAGN